jgi:hypothetical protein
MCLIKGTIRYPREDLIFTAYKVVRVDLPWRYSKAPKRYQALYQSDDIVMGAWHEDVNKQKIWFGNSLCNGTKRDYKPGFHFYGYKGAKALRETMGRIMSLPGKYRILECIISNVTATGKDTHGKAYVAKSFRPMREVE